MRARNLKPGFFKNPELADAGPIVQLLFAGLWLLADKEGRLKDQPRVIKAEVFPYYDADVNGGLTVLSRLGHIRRYVNSGIAVIEIINFKKHQSPHHTEKASDLPPSDDVSDCKNSTPETHGELTVNSPLDNGGNPSDSLNHDSLIPDSLNHDSVLESTPAPRAAPVFEHWQKVFEHPKAVFDPKRKRLIEARLKQFSVQDLCDAISGYKLSPFHQGKNSDGKVFDDIELFLRDAKHVEEGLKFLRNPPRPPPDPRQLSAVERVRLANGGGEKRDERVVSEQRAGQSFGDVELFGGDVRQSSGAGLRRLGS